MATYDDYDGAYFTSAALRLYHPEVRERVGILVVDNNPRGAAAWALKALEREIEGLRYLPVDDITSAAVKDRVIREANSEWVLVVDSHVLIAPGAIARLLEFIDAHPGCDDLLQGPLLSRGGYYVSLERAWHNDLYGAWLLPALRPGRPDPEDESFEIEMQGLGLFACRKDSWPGYSPHFRGHGAEEGYIHAKYRSLGRRTLCLPFLAWEHRFGRPLSAPYRHTFEERIRNYLVASDEVGYPPLQEVIRHFRDEAQASCTDEVVRSWEREKSSPLAFFDVIAVLNPQRDEERWRHVHDEVAAVFGVEKCLRRITLPPLDVDQPVMDDGVQADVLAEAEAQAEQVTLALSHRHLIARAVNENWPRLLVVDDDVTFLPEAGATLASFLTGLEHGHAWTAIDLSGPQDGTHTDGPTAIGYHESAYRAVLDALPEDPAGARAALATAGGSLTGLLSRVLPLGRHRLAVTGSRAGRRPLLDGARENGIRENGANEPTTADLAHQ
ncbi:glycosyltransferase family A protein [Streptomyces ureilyticus]|uniref:Glycosyltransferase n=1 Tax=Streptomyces ureilyticus TaxID=1775131 RepID=A0ABX0DHC8_9ACTN|nr:glycosyltransferase family A protein [Streptomyces ureilyticus]NGO41276.1 glycosyltransferase [Streptomyces ureilyticus]